MKELSEGKKIEFITKWVMEYGLSNENRLKMLINFAITKDDAILFGKDNLSNDKRSAKEAFEKFNGSNIDGKKLLEDINHLIDTLKETSYADGKTANSMEIGQLEKEIEILKTKNDIMTQSKIKPLKYVMYFVILFLIAIGLTIVAIYFSPKSETTISIEYNIGEIIGAILGGGGIAFAGIAYALKTSKELD